MEPGERIKRLRERAGLSQAELAELAGTTQPALSAYEHGQRRPSEATLRRIVLAANVRPSLLLEHYHDAVIDAVEEHGGVGVWIFGSVARGEDTPESDLDLLVRMKPDATLFDLAALGEAIKELLGIEVDVVSEGGLKPERDDDILAEARAF